jgi:serine/threonine-protein kinase PpkA
MRAGDLLCCQLFVYARGPPFVIEIPGYRIDRPIGRGGMSTVYLALQESVQREVALKIMAGSLLGDEEFGERFLREARIAASLRHPNVVHVYDVGLHGEHHYMAMEHLPGGPVLQRRGPRRDFAFALRAVREIASALDYAHKRGVVHRDIKPDNILLREDGSAVLTDFGIARAGDSLRMTRTGAIIGTPHYMSPEQARGQPLDGRADLYSLGVVFYQLLVGEVPYQAEDSMAVGIMHITAPVPRLPAQLDRLQPLLDRLLAKEPAARVQSGAELVVELDALAGMDLALPEPPVRPRRANSSAPSTTPTVVTPQAPAPGRGPRGQQRDPALGSLSAIEAEAGHSPRGFRGAAPRRSASRWPLWAAFAVLLLGGAAFLLRDPLGQWLAGSDRAEQLQRAEQALQVGRLEDDAQGPGARSLFNAVLAAEPDHEAARAGLARVGIAHLEVARAAALAGRGEAAQQSLAAARGLGVAPTALADVEALLKPAGESERIETLARLIEAAADALAQGRIETAGDGAIALYQQALEMDPGNQVARAGLRSALAPLLARASASIEAADFAQAEADLAVVGQADPGHLDLPQLRGRLAEARKLRADRIQSLLSEARARSQRGHWVRPTGESARDAYLELQRFDPGNAEAEEGLRRLGAELLRQAGAATADFDFERAEAALDAATLLQPAPSGLGAARERLAAARERYQRLPGTATADPARVAALIAEAQAALQAGRLLHPPGESAYDSLRAALQLDPGSGPAKALLDSLPEQARQRFRTAMAESNPGRAFRYLEGLQVVAPNDPALPAMRQQLALAYLGLANERLGRGELSSARQALDRAAELEPNHAELPSLRARLEQAGG